MWSYPFTGKRSLFKDSQRMHFLVDGNDEVINSWKQAKMIGCTSLYVEDFSNLDTLSIVKGIFSKDETLQREDLCIIGKCGSSWSISNIYDRCKKSLQLINTSYIDAILLPSNFSIDSETLLMNESMAKEAWSQLVLLKNDGMVKHIGVSDYSIQNIELIINAFDCNELPEVAEMVITPYSAKENLVRFCQTKQIDVIGRIPLSLDENIKKRKAAYLNDTVLVELAESYSNVHFSISPLAERLVLETEIPQVETTIHMKKDPIQVVIRWIHQRGLIALPVPINDHRIFHEEEIRLLYSLLNPLTSLSPHNSPTFPYSFVLSANDMKKIKKMNIESN